MHSLVDSHVFSCTDGSSVVALIGIVGVVAVVVVVCEQA